jgi:tetratricopeptide (TPR) repeat protein
LAKLEQALSQYRLPLGESIPLFASLLSLPLPEDRYPLPNLSPQRQRQKTLEAIVVILTELAERQPVLCIVEDLHWTDPSTLELLNLVIDQIPTTSILTVLTCRPHFQPAWHHRSYITAMTLSHLSHTQVAQIVAGMTEGKTFPHEVLQQIIEKTDGVPLFVEELTKALLESGQLTAVDGRYELTGSFSMFAIPATLQDSLTARLDRLVTAKAIAQYAAVIGRQFSYVLLHAVAQVDGAMLQHELGRLVEAEIVYRRGLPPHTTYFFKHALIQEAAYQSLLRSTRQQYHQRIAQVLAERFPAIAKTQPEVVAQHYTAAGLHAQALPYWQQAGHLALERSAYREAMAFLERALAAVPYLPQTRTTLEQAIDLRLALRTALRPLGDWGRTLAVLREAETLAVTLDDPRRLGRVSIFLSIHFRFMGAYDRASAAGQRALTLATASSDGAMQALANHYLSMVYHAQGDYRRAIACCGRTLAYFDGEQRPERFGATLPPVASRAMLAWCHAELGTFPAGRICGDAGLRIAEAVNHPASLLTALWGRGVLALRQGHLPRALALLERAVSLCQDADHRSYFPRMAAPLGVAYALSGRVADAVALLTHALEQSKGIELFIDAQLCRLSLGAAQLRAGQQEEAQALAEGVLTLTRTHQECGNEAYALHLLGDITARRDTPDTDLAEAHYQQALIMAKELGMRPLQAHCHRGLGMLYAMTGQREQARAELSTAIEMYRDMEMTFWLPQTEAALAQVKAQ